jgi:hypothetical protein
MAAAVGRIKVVIISKPMPMSAHTRDIAASRTSQSLSHDVIAGDTAAAVQ